MVSMLFPRFSTVQLPQAHPWQLNQTSSFWSRSKRMGKVFSRGELMAENCASARNPWRSGESWGLHWFLDFLMVSWYVQPFFNHFFVSISRYLTGYFVKSMAMVDIQSQRSDFGRVSGLTKGVIWGLYIEDISYIWLYDLSIYNLYKYLPFFPGYKHLFTMFYPSKHQFLPPLCQVIGFGNACGTIACLPTARMFRGRKTEFLFGHGKDHGNHQLL